MKGNMERTPEQVEEQIAQAETPAIVEAIRAEQEARRQAAIERGDHAEVEATERIIARADVSLDVRRAAAEMGGDRDLEDDEEDLRAELEGAYAEGVDERAEELRHDVDAVEREQRAAGYYVAKRPAREHRRLVAFLTGAKPRSPRRAPRHRGARRPAYRTRARRPSCRRRVRSSSAQGGSDPPSSEPDSDRADLDDEEGDGR
jgi:hypothetical protein